MEVPGKIYGEPDPGARPGSEAPAARAFAVSALCVSTLTVVANKLQELATYNGVPITDSGVFASIGKGILAGQIPYRDLWDHKPPGIFMVNAAILGVFSPAPWDLHLLEIPLSIATVAAFYWLVRAFASRRIAGAGAVLFAFFSTIPALNEGGNLTETYAMLPVILAYGLALRTCLGKARTDGRRGSPDAGDRVSLVRLLLIGACCSAAVLLKPQAAADLAIVQAVIAGPILIRRFVMKQEFGAVTLVRAFVPTGFVLGVSAATVAYFVSQGAGGAMWSEFVVYNSVYARTVSLHEALQLLTHTPYGIFLWFLAGWAAVAVGLSVRTTLRSAHWEPGARRPLRLPRDMDTWTAFVVMAWWLVGVWETSADRHFWSHDFLLSVPSSIALCTLALHHRTHRSRARAAGSLIRRLATAALPALTCAGLLTLLLLDGAHGVAAFSRLSLRHGSSPPGVVWNLTRSARPPDAYGLVSVAGWTVAMRGSGYISDDQAIAQAIVRLTTPHDRVFIWGGPLGSYFLSGRSPASRFLYDMPLIDAFGNTKGSGYSTPALNLELVSDLRRARPRLVILERQDAGAFHAVPSLAAFWARFYRYAGHVRSISMPGGYELYTRSRAKG